MFQRDHTYKYNGKKISYKIWFSDDSSTIDTVIFLGTVQIDKLTQWVAESSPPRTAIIQGAPHWFAKEDGSDIPSYMFNYTKDSFDSLVADFELKGLNIIADSQAVPGVIQLFAQDNYKSYMKNLVLLQPLGLNANSFAGTDDQRIDTFKNRIIKNAYHQLTDLLLDSRLRYNYRLLSKTVSFRDPKARAQYNSGLKYDSLPDLRALMNISKDVTIVCGAKDKIFMANEIKKHLRQANLSIEVVIVKNIPHSPLATRKGLVLLNKAFTLFPRQKTPGFQARG